MIKKNILEILLKKFPPSEYALLAEVRDSAGFAASRSADFLLMGLWPSRGLNLIGIERKSYRGDWLKELKQPEKAENIFQYCDKWYLLTDNENIAKIEEIPEKWGWFHIDSKDKLKVIKEAEKLSPVPVSRSFLACLLKRAANKDGYVLESSIADRITAAKESGKKERDMTNEQRLESFQTLLKNVSDFEEATGMKLHNQKWGQTGKKQGEIVKFIENGGIEQMKKQIVFIKNYHSQIGKTIEDFDLIFP